MRNRNRNKGVIAIAFGGGFLLACFCPSGFAIGALAIAVVLLGISFLRCC